MISKFEADFFENSHKINYPEIKLIKKWKRGEKRGMKKQDPTTYNYIYIYINLKSIMKLI